MQQMSRVPRRAVLRALALAPMALGASARARAAEAAGLVSSNVCLVAPEVTEGPFYLDPGLVRAEITEGRPGVPLELTLQVVTEACVPVPGARVNVWHCDAMGNYSGYRRQGSDGALDTRGETFLRGTQFADTRGVVRFRTIWPGWYRGRTTHLHYKVFLDERTALTSQIFFPDPLSQAIYRSAEPYKDRAGRQDTTNASDRIAARAGEGAFAEVSDAGDRYVAALVVGIDAATA